MKNCGFSMNQAKQIESAYHTLYKQSDDWVADKLKQASINGYVLGAFGLKVRTPMLYTSIRGSSVSPYQVEAEGRTAGNALGQSYGLLNNRACTEFMRGVRRSRFKLSIKPCCHIHDAQYYLIKDDLYHLLYINKYLVKAVEWQDLPDITHDTVKLGGNVSVFHPNWGNELELPNNISKTDLLHLINIYKDKQ